MSQSGKVHKVDMYTVTNLGAYPKAAKYTPDGIPRNDRRGEIGTGQNTGAASRIFVSLAGGSFRLRIQLRQSDDLQDRYAPQQGLTFEQLRRDSESEPGSVSKHRLRPSSEPLG